MNKIVDDFEKYELVMRQMRKVLIRMDEVLLECTNITPEECSDWNKVFESLKESVDEFENKSALNWKAFIYINSIFWSLLNEI